MNKFKIYGQAGCLQVNCVCVFLRKFEEQKYKPGVKQRSGAKVKRALADCGLN